jgi:hypothetical protein
MVSVTWQGNLPPAKMRGLRDKRIPNLPRFSVYRSNILYEAVIEARPKGIEGFLIDRTRPEAVLSEMVEKPSQFCSLPPIVNRNQQRCKLRRQRCKRAPPAVSRVNERQRGVNVASAVV